MRVVTLRSSKDNPVYLIGDVHGMSGPLRILLEAISLDAAASSATPRIVFLGDIVDRGEDSRGAMDAVADVLGRYPGSSLILGNHDEVFLDAVRGRLDDRKYKFWIEEQGGDKTAISYLGEIPTKVGDLASSMLSKFEQHIHLLEEAADMVLVDDYCAVHAGINPERSLAEQTERDVRWIRAPFLICRLLFEKRIIHGHTVTEENLGAEVYRNRIAMDAGAVLGAPFVQSSSLATNRFASFFERRRRPAKLRQHMEDDLVLDRFQ